MPVFQNIPVKIIEGEDGSLRINDIFIPGVPPPALMNRASQRLIVTRLTLSDFKSYAGKQTLGPFNKNFTAVVGANGSGKSNVIDALLFVFGSRAKKIRSKKVSQLIHNSKQYPNCTSCSVTVDFETIQDTENGFSTIPGKEFVISRTALADDSSYYEMNYKRCTYKTVGGKLQEYGIDLEHSRFLILQGEVERISLMQPKAQKENEIGMLEHVEEIIGSNRFIEPIKILHEQVQKLDEIKQEKHNMLKFVEKKKDELQESKDKAVKYLRLQNQLVLLENSLLHLKCMETEKDLEAFSEKKNDHLNKINSLKMTLDDIKTSRKSLENELEKITRTYEAHQNICEDCKEKYRLLEKRDVDCSDELKNLRNKNGKLENTLEATKVELDKLMKKTSVYERETAELNEMKKKFENEKKVEEEKHTVVMGSVSQETGKLKEEKDKLTKQLKELKNKVQHGNSELALLHQELNVYENVKEKETKTLSELIRNHKEMVDAVSQDEKKLKQDEERITKLKDELSSLKEHHSSLRHKEASLSEKLKCSKISYNEAKNSLTFHKHRSAMMQAFMKEKARGRMLGVCGRLGDLGAIDEKYDVAISTACSHLDSIVTDTIQTAQEGIAFLKKSNLAYATFIPLEKMAGWEPYINKRISTPENILRIYDLVRVKDKKMLPAFYYALRDTLVANDIEQGTRIGLQGNVRYRVVTLKGEVVELSGAMTGGGGRAQRGRMGQTVVECNLTSDDISKMGAELDVLSKTVVELKTSSLQMEDEISDKSKALSSLMLSIKLQKQRYDENKKSVSMLKSQIEEQKKKMNVSQVDTEQIEVLQSQIEEKTKSLSEVSAKVSAVEQKISKLQNEITKITTGKVDKVNKHMNELSKKVNEYSTSLSKSVLNVNTSKKSMKKLQEKIDSFQKTIEENKEKIKSVREEKNSITEKATAVKEKQISADNMMKECKEKRIDVKKNVEQIVKREHELKLEEIELKSALQKYENLEKEKRACVQSINTKLGKLKLNEVENDSTMIPSYTPEEVTKLSHHALTSEMEVTKANLEDIKPNLSAIKEYKKMELSCDEKQKELNNVINERNSINSVSEELRKRRLQEFMTGFKVIATKLKEIYQMLTFGGDAELELIDSTDPFIKGVEFSARPPRKSWKYMRNLSGGEKTLSSISLVFALHYYRPTPFYVMDEIDAALDERNVALVREFLKRQTDTQLINVSLRNIMNEEADHLLGIYKKYNCSEFTRISNVSEWYRQNGYAG